MYLIMKARSEPYLRSQEVADVLGITKRTLMNWLRTQKIPEPERNQANRYRRWTAQDVERIRQTIAENNSDWARDSQPARGGGQHTPRDHAGAFVGRSGS